MLDFVKIFLFSHMVALTPEPINIDEGCLELDLQEPISAITKGATLQIDVSSMVPDGIEGVVETRNWVDKKFASGFAKAILIDSGRNNNVVLRYGGESSWTESRVHLLLSNSDGVPVNTNYEKIVLETSVNLHEVRIVWKNYQK